MKHPFLAALVWTIAAVAACSTLGTSAYEGDGVLSKLRFALNPGVRIDFEKFSLDKPYRARYRLDGLPPHRSGYFAGLAVEVTQTDHAQQPTALVDRSVGVLDLRLQDNRGQTLFECKGPVEELQWSWVVGERLGRFASRGADRVKESFIYPEYFEGPASPATLHVEYEPSDNAPAVVAWIRLNAGGQK